MNKDNQSSEGNPPVFSPPALRVSGKGRNGALVISQTPNILLYLGEKLGLVPDDEAGKLYVNQLTLTALDLDNEIHDTHHVSHRQIIASSFQDALLTVLCTLSP